MNPADRVGYLGGSDAAVVLGLSPWRTRYQLFCEKQGIEVPAALDQVEFVYFGTVLEPIVAKEFEKRSGKRIRTRPELVKHPKYSFIAGHVDRIVLGEPAILECKTSNAFDYRKWGPDGGAHSDIPDYYLAQVDHYMMVTGRTRSYLAVLIGGNEYRCYTIERSAAREALLRDALREFWDRLQRDDPPEITTEEDARRRWREVLEGTAVPVDALVRAKVARLSDVLSKIKPLEKEEKTLRDELFPLFADRELLSSNGEPIARLSGYMRSSFDKTAFDAKHPKLSKRFTSSKPTKRLKILI